MYVCVSVLKFMLALSARYIRTIFGTYATACELSVRVCMCVYVCICVCVCCVITLLAFPYLLHFIIAKVFLAGFTLRSKLPLAALVRMYLAANVCCF